jgi:hypothetical protein
MDELQSSLVTLTRLADGGSYGRIDPTIYPSPLPLSSELGTVTALGADFMAQRKRRMLDIMEQDILDNSSDYNEGEEESDLDDEDEGDSDDSAEDIDNDSEGSNNE